MSLPTTHNQQYMLYMKLNEINKNNNMKIKRMIITGHSGYNGAGQNWNEIRLGGDGCRCDGQSNTPSAKFYVVWRVLDWVSGPYAWWTSPRTLIGIALTLQSSGWKLCWFFEMRRNDKKRGIFFGTRSGDGKMTTVLEISLRPHHTTYGHGDRIINKPPKIICTKSKNSFYLFKLEG